MLYNKIKKKKIIEKIKFANNWFEKFRGLMFESQENFNYALVFEVAKEGKLNASVHMLFVFFSIDVVFLNKEKKVVDLARLKPFIINYTPKKAAKFIVELPKGKAKEIEVGDKLEWN